MSRLNKIRLLSGMLLASLLLWGCQSSTPVQPGGIIFASDFATYAYPGNLFTVGLPTDWIVNDTSQFSAVNVEFSPPGSPQAQLTIFVANLGDEPSELNALADTFVRLFYDDAQAPYKEVARDQQPDGSLRLSGVLQAPGNSTQRNDFLQRIGPYFVALRVTLPSDPNTLRTLNRILDTFELNEAAVWQRGIQGLEVAARQGAVGFSSLNDWTDNTGSFNIAGQILNNATTPLEFVRVTALLYDANNDLVGERGDFIAADVVQSGEFSPFKILFPDGLPPGTARYELQATARFANFAAETFYGPANFAIIDSADFDLNGLLVVTGQVTNNGPQRASLVKVIVTVFDSNQEVVATDTTLVEAQSLQPGETSTFRVQFAQVGGAADTYLSIAQASIIP